MRMIRLPVCVLVAIMGSITATNATAQAAKSGPEHARLAAMAGVWDVEVTFWLRPGGPGIASKACQRFNRCSAVSSSRRKSKARSTVRRSRPSPGQALIRSPISTRRRASRVPTPFGLRRLAATTRRQEAVRAQGGVSARRRYLAPTHGHPADLRGHDDGNQLSELRRGARVEGRRDQVHAAHEVAVVMS